MSPRNFFAELKRRYSGSLRCSIHYGTINASSSDDPVGNSLIDFAKNGFGDTQMFGLVARWPELLKRIASMFASFLAGEAGLIEPRLLELTGFIGS